MKKQAIVFTLALLGLFSACADKDDMKLKPDDTPSVEIGEFTVLKSGTLNRQSGTNTTGQVQLVQNTEGKFFVRLSENFTTKFSTGTVTVYLSTSSTLRLNDTASFQLLGQANRAGEHIYALNAAPDAKFNHGIIWCGAAAIPFGFAMLE